MIKNCEQCKNEFSAKRKDQIFCNKKCWGVNYYNRDVERSRIRKRTNARKHNAQHAEAARKYRAENSKECYEAERKRILESPKLLIYKSLLRDIKKNFKCNRMFTKSKWIAMLPFSLSEFKESLISSIPEGYVWQDYIDGKLQLDHIKEHSKFNYEIGDEAEFKECWSLENLRLLPAYINISKLKREQYDNERNHTSINQ